MPATMPRPARLDTPQPAPVGKPAGKSAGKKRQDGAENADAAQKTMQKMKMLLLAEMLERETDENHPMLIRQIVEKLRAKGVSCGRRTVPGDIALLNEYGYEMGATNIGHEKGYYMARHTFSVAEFQILIDEVTAAKFLTPGKTAELVGKLADLAGCRRNEVMRGGTAGRAATPKHSNEAIYANVEALGRAIADGKKASFRYFTLDMNGRQDFHADGVHRVVDPVALIVDNGNYYLVGYVDDGGRARHYRLDRMDQVSEEKEDATRRADADSDGGGCLFGMYSGDTREVTLEFDKGLIGAVQDRFGEDVEVTRTPSGTYTATVWVQVAPTFWGWLFQFSIDKGEGVGMRILAPASLADEYRGYARRVANE